MPDLLKNKLVMIGGGGHFRSVIDSIHGMERWKEAEIVVTDQDAEPGIYMQGCKVVGTDELLPELYRDGFHKAVISVGSIKDTKLRRNLFSEAKKIGFSFPVIVDKSAEIAKDVVMEEGVFAGKHAVVNSGSMVHRFVILNTGSIIEHDCEIGAFSHISIGAVICGGCIVEEDVFVGANATIIQGIHIGRNSIIGAASVVLADVPDNVTVKGVWGKKEFERCEKH